MKHSYEEIEKAKEILKESGYLLGQLWHEIDIKSQAEQMDIELSEESLKKVVDYLNRLDSNIGINWESIEMAINEVVPENERIPLEIDDDENE